ncbi:MAG: 1-acyl-sn-glycerol-3-phosphate acyltransferase [Saprospiraceae bacterium]|nr:1-acyl-sn-glycerol-3-phosphate acyltransferase [Saprospiraceae bacterium]
MVRGDVFENPFLRPILKSTHQIPIFRFRDGFSKLRENSHTIDESLQVLIENKNLLIFAEGSTESVKKLRPLQKGIVRIAFQALEKNPELELEILPVGLNFTYPTDFNEEVMLQVGQPILVQKYFESYKTDKTKHMNGY